MKFWPVFPYHGSRFEIRASELTGVMVGHRWSVPLSLLPPFPLVELISTDRTYRVLVADLEQWLDRFRIKGIKVEDSRRR